jgi:hypothetical protein
MLTRHSIHPNSGAQVRRAFILVSVVAILVTVLSPAAHAVIEGEGTYSREEITTTPFVVWWGDRETMTVSELVSYCAPILWFSPDEPLLEGRSGKDILIPEPFPFEERPDRPVVYYRIRRIVERSDETGAGFVATGDTKADAVIHLKRIAGIDLDFFFYYPREEGLNAHEHDVESLEMKVAVARGKADDVRYALAVTRSVGKAHGVLWYDNTLESDMDSRFPLHVMVEEAKHASCPDKNGDGMYTPGYDVNTRINDAWGIRDIIRSGGLFSASWQSWMAKIRWPRHRVFPPLPPDAPRRGEGYTAGGYTGDNAVYELRPFPTAEKADDHLAPFITGKGYPDWPEVDEVDTLEKFGDWMSDESWVKSFSLALRIDGNLGISFMFPFFLFKNLEDPMGGGYILHRVYLTGDNLNEWGYTAIYTPSASRWIDFYTGLGFENRLIRNPDGTTNSRYDFQYETGLKFRVNIMHTPLKLARYLGTDFWGFRFGVRFLGAMDIDALGYVVEIGAGSF